MKTKRKVATTIHSAVCILSMTLLFTCGSHNKHKGAPAAPPQKDPPGDQEPTDLTFDPETHAWWTERVNNTLRLSEPVDSVSGSSEFSKMKPKDVVAAMMNDAGYYDMMTDFTMYWLGIKGPGIFAEDHSTYPWKKIISPSVAKHHQVVNAVKAMAANNNYFANLFKETGPIILYEVNRLYGGPQQPNQPEPTNAEIRAKLLEKAKEQVATLIPLAKPESKTEFCDAYDNFYIGYLGGPNGLNDSESSVSDPFDDWCYFDEAKIPNDPAALLNAKISYYENLIADLNAIDQRLGGRSPLAVSHVTDLDLVRLSTGAIVGRQYSEEFFQLIQNSSTNRNRKRAAWALKRFFCDDLTPINVEAPSSHVGGQHGSDPACYSCHYKLDPMAGYFRELGFFGVSFASSPQIFFDDGANASRVDYEKPWKAAPETGREWNIGYIRSTTDDKLNTFGSNFTDLLQLLQTAPEVKECFVRRAFEYVVGENQVVDRGWLKSVTAKMTETEKTSTTAAIKGVFADIVMSKAFLARDRNNNECYDLPTGTAAKNRAPCQIANIIERNCASCHSETSKQGGLDLTTWKVQANGQPGFNHTADGQPLPPSESFQKILERLATTDQSKRMPLMRAMPPQDLEALFLWLQKSASNAH
jgi:hypothetical protein